MSKGGKHGGELSHLVTFGMLIGVSQFPNCFFLPPLFKPFYFDIY
jgi:hypothetical protein